MALARFAQPLQSCREACDLAVSNGTPKRAARMSLIVGTLLIFINQWEALTGQAALDWLKLVLTYTVPYVVTTYTSVSKDLHILKESREAEQQVHSEAESNIRQENH